MHCICPLSNAHFPVIDLYLPVQCEHRKKTHLKGSHYDANLKSMISHTQKTFKTKKSRQNCSTAVVFIVDFQQVSVNKSVSKTYVL